MRAEGAIYIKGRPTIISHRTQFGIIGDDVGLECVAYSIPRPDHIVWSFDGEEINPSDPYYRISEEPLPNGIKSILEIRDSQSRHFGVYNCSVANPYGVDWAEILLKAQSKSSSINYWNVLMKNKRAHLSVQINLNFVSKFKIKVALQCNNGKKIFFVSSF